MTEPGGAAGPHTQAPRDPQLYRDALRGPPARTACAVCPVDCIHGKDDDPQLYINPDDCIDCTLCVDACPVTAIFAEEDLPDQWSSFTASNADFFKK